MNLFCTQAVGCNHTFRTQKGRPQRKVDSSRGRPFTAAIRVDEVTAVNGSKAAAAVAAEKGTYC